MKYDERMSRDHGRPASSRPRRGEIVTTAIVWLLLGAIVNVAVAWGLAGFHRHVLWGDFQQQRAEHARLIQAQYGDDRNWQITYLPKTGTAYFWARDIPREWGFVPGVRLVPDDIYDSDLPAWCGFSQSPQERSGSLPYWTAMARGWPLYSMCNRVEEDTRTLQRVVHNAVRIPLGKAECRLVRGNESFLPLCPVWPGFTMNTLFYAGILWLLFAAPLALRRWRRIKRGLCPKCAYPIGTSEMCTECGGELRHKVQSTTTADL